MTLAEKIAAAEAALHKLMTGALEVEVSYGDRTVRFAATDIGKLRGYIAELKAQDAGAQTRGAIGFVF